MDPVGNSAARDSMWGPGSNPGSNQFQKRNNEWNGGTVNSSGAWGDNQQSNNSRDPGLNPNINNPMGRVSTVVEFYAQHLTASKCLQKIPFLNFLL